MKLFNDLSGNPAGIKTTINGGMMFVPLDPANTDYAEIMRQLSAETLTLENHVISSKPYPSWTLDVSFEWQPPTTKPDDGKSYDWNEDTQAWDEIVEEEEEEEEAEEEEEEE